MLYASEAVDSRRVLSLLDNLGELWHLRPMRALIHIGMHKTATTYLQTMLRDAHSHLAEHGIWFEPIPWYPAHHELAWAILRGNYGILSTMVENAKSRSCHTIIFSSEDLESILSDNSYPRNVEKHLQMAGITKIEWHACLRRPDEYFWSAMAETARHTYIDIAQSFFSVLRKGYLRVDGPPYYSAESAPFWHHNFDGCRFMQFSEDIEGSLKLHDFHRPGPFPGFSLLEQIRAPIVFPTPETDAENRRDSDDLRDQNYLNRFSEVIGQTLTPLLADHVLRNQRFSQDARTEMSNEIFRLFEPTRLNALAKFGVGAEENVLPARPVVSE